MSWSERAHSLLRQGYSEAEAYAIVAAERGAERNGGIEGDEGRGIVRRCADSSTRTESSDLDPHLCTADCCAVDDQEAAA